MDGLHLCFPLSLDRLSPPVVRPHLFAENFKTPTLVIHGQLDATGVSDELAAMIVLQPPAQPLVREISFQSGHRRRRIVDRKNHLRRPHFFRLLLAEQASVAVLRIFHG